MSQKYWSHGSDYTSSDPTDSSSLFINHNSFTKLDSCKKHMSENELITSLPKDNSATVLKSRLQFHKQLMAIA